MFIFQNFDWAVWVLQVVLTPTHLAIVMEYAAGGELFERICNAGRFSEDEVWFILALHNFDLLSISGPLWKEKKILLIWLCCLKCGEERKRFYIIDCHIFVFVQARYFFQQLISGVSYCHSMVKITLKYQKDVLSDLLVNFSHFCFICFIFICSKYATEIWSWKTLCWMEAQHLAWKYVILVTQRFDIINRSGL